MFCQLTKTQIGIKNKDKNTKKTEIGSKNKKKETSINKEASIKL